MKTVTRNLPPNLPSESFNHLTMPESAWKAALKGCCDALETYDESQREQTYYKNLIRESFKVILKKNSNLVKAFTLDN